MHHPRLVLAGTRSGSGKTTISLALMAALRRRGLIVQPFKVGPDYIDPAFHRMATGRPSHNLDAWLTPPATMKELFQKHAPATGRYGKSGISLIEGVMGFYDGLGRSAFAGTAHVASLLRAPVVLIMDAQGLSLSAAAVVSGYAAFRPETEASGAFKTDLAGLTVAGVILNRVAGPRHYEILRDCIESNTGIHCFGCLPKNAAPALPERHLGLVPPEELQGLEGFFSSLADLAENHLDIPGLLRLASDAPRRETSESQQLPKVAANPPLRIGVPRDAAFSFYYQDNLDLLADMGAELIYCSPLTDASLPPGLDGLYMGGGFPEMFLDGLQKNQSFRDALKQALEQGLPAYAECGAMLYLCASLAPANRDTPEEREGRAMAGFFPDRAAMTRRLQPFGYITVTLLRDCLLGPAGSSFPAHEFHYSRLLKEDEGEPLFRMEKPDGRSWTGGLQKKNVVAGFPHLHFRGCPEAARSFLAACLACRQTRGGRA